MGHHHTHASPDGNQDYSWAFAISVSANFIFVVLEAIYAIAANSMSLLADAGHNLGDVLGLAFAWFANYLLQKKSADRYSYGFKKSTILSANINALLLVASSAIIGYESIVKFFYPAPVDELTVIVVALIGIIINGGTALLFLQGRHRDLNIKGAFLHLAYDALISFGVVVVGTIIFWRGWEWLDPIVGLAIVISIFIGTWDLLRDSVDAMLDAVPHHVNLNQVRDYLESLPGVSSLHDLHIWAISTQESALTAHLVMPERTLTDRDYQDINETLRNQHNISHVTLQIEQGDQENLCPQKSSCSD